LARYGGPNQLWHNNGNGTFSLVARGVEYNGHTFSSAWGDYDHDGRQDLALGLDGDVDGTAVRIYHQRDDGNLDDVPTAIGTAGSTGRIFGLAWGDYTGDGFEDLLAANQTGNNLLYRSVSGITLVEEASVANVQGGLGGTSPAWMDVDNDRDLDLYVVNFGN